jgi:hypothetical protein
MGKWCVPYKAENFLVVLKSVSISRKTAPLSLFLWERRVMMRLSVSHGSVLMALLSPHTRDFRRVFRCLYVVTFINTACGSRTAEGCIVF